MAYLKQSSDGKCELHDGDMVFIGENEADCDEQLPIIRG